jgi:hypothetical protein
MLSAPKETNKIRTDETRSDSSISNARCAVLDSMKNLCEVLQGMNLIEIVEAHREVQILVQQASTLHTELTNLGIAKRFVTGVAVASAAGTESKIQPMRELLKKHSQGQESKAPNNLIRFPDNPKVAKQGAGVVPRDPLLDRALALVEHRPLLRNRSAETDVSLTRRDINPSPTPRVNHSARESSEIQKGEPGSPNAEGKREESQSLSEKDGYPKTLPATTQPVPEPATSMKNEARAESLITGTTAAASVPSEFLDSMIEKLTEFIGPMASVIARDQIAELGESAAAFPKVRLEQLIELVSREISDNRLKVSFQQQISKEMLNFKLL